MKKVVVVDDDADILSILDYILREKGYDVVTSLCPKILLNISELKPDLILMDVWLGSGDGSHMCHILKSSQLTSDIPVVLISAINDLEDVAKLAGADYYIRKPFDIATIEQVVSDVAL